MTTEPARETRSPALLQVDGLKKSFRRAGQRVAAVCGVQLEVGAGERVALVGASGCGKSTLARCVVRLLRPDAGSIRFLGRDIARLGERALRPLRRDLQLVFQASAAALDPRQTVFAALAEPLICFDRIPVAERAAAVDTLLQQVGLLPEHAERYPEQLSGGQVQRVCIARALASRPKLLVADEPTSALDGATRGAIVRLLASATNSESGLLLITHDIRVARALVQRIYVMRDGLIVEQLPAAQLDRARHDYTRQLVARAMAASSL
jgi:oligopeptide transport system ATP-binding protein